MRTSEYLEKLSDEALENNDPLRALLLGGMKTHIEKLEAEITRSREALAWYGDEGNYRREDQIFDHEIGAIYKTSVQEDKGQRARKTLKGQGE